MNVHFITFCFFYRLFQNISNEQWCPNFSESWLARCSEQNREGGEVHLQCIACLNVQNKQAQYTLKYKCSRKVLTYDQRKVSFYVLSYGFFYSWYYDKNTTKFKVSRVLNVQAQKKHHLRPYLKDFMIVTPCQIIYLYLIRKKIYIFIYKTSHTK